LKRPEDKKEKDVPKVTSGCLQLPLAAGKPQLPQQQVSSVSS